MNSDRRLHQVLTIVPIGVLCTHLVSSVLENSPDSYNQELRKYAFGWTIPKWRFFAPNPGVQNVHLLIRETIPGQPAERWRDITPISSHTLLSVAWNPKSRGPKALFDAMQQLTLFQANNALFSWVATSEPYNLVSLAARKHTSEDRRSRYQFMILNVEPSAPEHVRMKPVLTSLWHDND